MFIEKHFVMKNCSLNLGNLEVIFLKKKFGLDKSETTFGSAINF